MIITTWNVRGMNDPIKLVDIKKHLKKYNIDVIGLIETKVKDENTLKIQKKFGNLWSWITTNGYSTKGRIWVGWRNDKVKVTSNQIHEQFIDCSITSFDLSIQIMCTFIYGLNTIEFPYGMLLKICQKNLVLGFALVISTLFSLKRIELMAGRLQKQNAGISTTG